MSYFHPDDIRAGVFGSNTTQRHNARFGHRTDSLGGFSELSSVQNRPYFPEKRPRQNTMEKHETIVKRINLSCKELFINSPMKKDKIFICGGIKKLEEILNKDEINILRYLTEEKDVPSMVKENAIALAFISYLYRDKPFHYIRNEMSVYLRELILCSYMEPVKMELCDKMADSIFEMICTLNSEQSPSHESRIIEAYNNSVGREIDKAMKKVQKVIGEDLTRDYEPSIYKAYCGLREIIDKKRENKLIKTYYEINTMHNLANHVLYIFKIEKEEKCTIL